MINGAIKWGYTYLGINDTNADKKIVSKWADDALKDNPRLWFGGEGTNNDARCQTEDVGDNSIVASGYGIKNFKICFGAFTRMDKRRRRFNKNLTQMYIQLVTQYNRYLTHVSKNVASVYETIKYPQETGDIYDTAPVEKQRAAVAFLNKELFETPTWLLNPDILNKIGNPIRYSSVNVIQDRQMNVLFSDRVFNTLNMMERRFGKEKTYSMIEFLADMKVGIWSELKTYKPIDQYRRDVQKSYVDALLRSIKEAEVGNNALGLLFGGAAAAETTPITLGSDIGAILALHLENLSKDIETAIPTTTDKDSKEHLQYEVDYIKNALSKRFNAK
jgi:hypothetical protein